MKRIKMIALVTGFGLLLTGCPASPALAEDMTEELFWSGAEEASPVEEPPAPEESQSDLQSEAPESADPAETENTIEGAGSNETEATLEKEPETQEITPPAETQSDPSPVPEPAPAPETEASLSAPETEIPSGETEKEQVESDAPETEQKENEKRETEPDGVLETEVVVDFELLTGFEAGEEAIEEETEELLEEETESVLEEESEWEETEMDYGYASYSGFGGYTWDESWFVDNDFRFTRVDKELALIRSSKGTFVYEKDDASSKKVGEIPLGGAVCVLKKLRNGWRYIESGDIRGFVPEEALRQDEAAMETISAIGEKALTQGDLLCEKADNQAFTYTKTTSYPVLAQKVYAVSLGSAWIYEYPDMASRFVGDVSNGSLLYILKELGNGWCFVESGDVRGFIPENTLLYGDGAKTIIKDLGEESAPLANELISPEENRSVYYTLRSVRSAGNEAASKICQSALAYVGKLPYVYGGTSLDNGCDCSGFVQSVFALCGVRLPRTAQEQGAAGAAVTSLESAMPGDVIYYASGPHVGIYLGEGKVVECSGSEANTAANPGPGPMVVAADYMGISSIRRYLIVRDQTNADGGYRTDDTPYSDEQLEIIWAVVAQEDNGSYDGALAVISSAMNRTESGRWSYAGSNALSQLTAPGQYCYSMDSYWIPRLNGNVPAYVKQAVDDCLRRGIRNHGYTSFRSTKGKTTGSGAVQIGGNWYFGS